MTDGQNQLLDPFHTYTARGKDTHDIHTCRHVYTHIPVDYIRPGNMSPARVNVGLSGVYAVAHILTSSFYITIL